MDDMILFQLSLMEKCCSISAADRASTVGLQPLVDTLAVELMAAGENPDDLSLLEVRHTDDTHRLFRVSACGLVRVPVARQLFYVTLGKTLRLHLSKPLREGEKSFVILGLCHIGAS